MVGPLVANRDAEPVWSALFVHDVAAHQLGFFTAILREGGDGETSIVAPEDCTVAFVEPLGVDTSDTTRGVKSVSTSALVSLCICARRATLPKWGQARARN